MNSVQLKNVALSNGETYGYRYRPGGDRTIVLVHGNLASSKFFEELMCRLPGEFTAYAPDMRGFGASTYNQPISEIKDFTDDLKLFVDHFNLEQFDLLGWSTGGTVSMLLCSTYGHLVDRLFLVASVAPSGYPVFGKDKSGQEVQLVTKQDFKNDPVRKSMQEAIENKDREFFTELWRSQIYNKKVPPKDIFEKQVEETLKQQNLLDVYYVLARFNITDTFNGVAEGTGEINKIKAPTVVVHGKEDLVVPAANAGMIKTLLQAKAELFLFDECGHSPFIDQLDELLALI